MDVWDKAKLLTLALTPPSAPGGAWSVRPVFLQHRPAPPCDFRLEPDQCCTQIAPLIALQQLTHTQHRTTKARRQTLQRRLPLDVKPLLLVSFLFFYSLCLFICRRPCYEALVCVYCSSSWSGPDTSVFDASNNLHILLTHC